MLGFTVINGHRGPRQTEPSRMSLAERLRRAKYNEGDLEIVEAHENPSISLDLSENELNALASRLVGGRVKSAHSTVHTSHETKKKKKTGGKKMRGKKKAEFLKRMAAGKKAAAKSNPRRSHKKNPRPKKGQRFHKDFSRADGVWLRAAKKNPTRAETAAREDFLTYRLAQGDTRAQADAAWRNALGMSAGARRRSGTRLGIRRRMGGLAPVASTVRARARRAAAGRRRRPAARRRPGTRIVYRYRTAPRRRASRRPARSLRVGFRHYMQQQIENKIAAARRGYRGRKPWYVNARISALRARHRGYGPNVSAHARNYLRLHGISKVNPGGYLDQLKEGGKALVGVMPEVLVAVGSAGVHTYLGGMVGKKVVEKWGADYAPYAGTAASLAIGVLGFLGMRMSPATAKYSVPFLTGGVVGAAVNLLADNHVKAEGAAPALSWGRKLDLPIGAVVLRSEFAGFDPYARHQLTAMGEVLPRRDFSGMGEVISRGESVAMLGEAEDRALNRLLGEVSQLQNDTSTGF